MLTTEKPIVFFDLEATGTDIAKDRIVEIALIKCDAQLAILDKEVLRVNPGMHIPEDASAVHGIYDKDVEGLPAFGYHADRILEFFKGCDIAGYNIQRFDIPMLAEEMLRCGRPFPDPAAKIIDSYRIFVKREGRSLSAAYKFYCDRELTDAHQAEADVLATIEVLQGQLRMYQDLGTSADALAKESEWDGERPADAAGKLRYDSEGELVFTFGKYKDKRVKEYLDYAQWMVEADFPLTTKVLLEEVLQREPGRPPLKRR